MRCTHQPHRPCTVGRESPPRRRHGHPLLLPSAPPPALRATRSHPLARDRERGGTEDLVSILRTAQGRYRTKRTALFARGRPRCQSEARAVPDAPGDGERSGRGPHSTESQARAFREAKLDVETTLSDAWPRDEG